MNINLRALVFGAAIAAALTATIDVVAAERQQIVRLDAIEVVAHRDAAGDMEVVHLDPVVVTAHKNPA
jgi:HAMP domain-containing protein